MSTLTVANLTGPGSSPVLTVTPPSSDNSTAIATTAFVRSYVSTLSPGFPFTLGVTPIGPTSITTALSGISLDACPIGQSSPGIATFTSLSSSAVNLTGGTINGTVIGGTTPAAGTFTTLIANTQTPGDNTTKAATTAFVQAGLFSTLASALGYSQTWQVVTRVGGTTYYNTTGAPIVLFVDALTSGNNATSTVSVSINSGSPINFARGGGVIVGQTFVVGNIIIPPGASYVLTYSSISGGPVTYELR